METFRVGTLGKEVGVVGGEGGEKRVRRAESDQPTRLPPRGALRPQGAGQ